MNGDVLRAFPDLMWVDKNPVLGYWDFYKDFSGFSIQLGLIIQLAHL